ncbi:MAG: MFS transporter [Planctomycetota bacterium]|nr:MFS transporter [Planctomycetota bacterium]
MWLRDIYPLRGLARPRQVWSWISFDVANQSFTLIINTLLFSIFFAKVVVNDDAIDDRLWALTYGASMLLTAALSPVLGAIADARAWRKEMLIGTGVLCGVLTCGLAFVQPGQLWLAVLLYIPANLCFALGENLLASFLPFLGPRDRVGGISGFSWGCAYGAALLLLVITAASMIGLGLKDPAQWRPFFVFAGVWFLALLVPTAIWLREPDVREPAGKASLVGAAYERLRSSVRNVASFRDLTMLLVASMFYGTGMSVVIFFASKLASEYGFEQADLVIFVAVITVSGIVGTFVPTFLQDRLGHRRSTVLLLIVWIVSVGLFALYAFRREAAADPAAYPAWPMWAVGNALGFGLGSLGTANRAFVGFLAPESKSAEVFGVWGLVFKLAAVLTFPFAWAKDTLGTPAALLVLAGFLGVGLVLTLLVDERRGAAAAAKADAQAMPRDAPTPVANPTLRS